MSRHSRRHLLRGSLALAGLGLLAGCGVLPLPGQQAAKVPRIGFLGFGSREGRAPFIAAFLEGLHDLGYVEAQSFTIEYRFSEGGNDRLRELAAELVALRMDVILASGTPAVIAAKQATSTVPIVIGASADPVGTGLVDSLARPGGNVTGIGIMAPTTAGKKLELLREAIPGLSRVAVLLNVNSPASVILEREIKAAAQDLNIMIDSLPVRSAQDLEGAFRTAQGAGDQAVYLSSDPLFTNARDQLAVLGRSYRFPTMFELRENVVAGGLFAYGPVYDDLYRRAAAYVDRILKGTKPADLPVEQARKLNLAMNKTTAEALDLQIPQSFLQQVDEVIQ